AGDRPVPREPRLRDLDPRERGTRPVGRDRLPPRLRLARLHLDVPDRARGRGAHAHRPAPARGDRPPRAAAGELRGPVSAPVVILSPHPDDAVLGCWSVLEGADAPVHVVNVFAEIPSAGTRGGWDNECGVP